MSTLLDMLPEEEREAKEKSVNVFMIIVAISGLASILTLSVGAGYLFYLFLGLFF